MSALIDHLSHLAQAKASQFGSPSDFSIRAPGWRLSSRTPWHRQWSQQRAQHHPQINFLSRNRAVTVTNVRDLAAALPVARVVRNTDLVEFYYNVSNRRVRTEIVSSYRTSQHQESRYRTRTNPPRYWTQQLCFRANATPPPRRPPRRGRNWRSHQGASDQHGGDQR